MTVVFRRTHPPTLTETTLTEPACHENCMGLEERIATITWQTQA